MFEGDPHRAELVLDTASGKTTVYLLDEHLAGPIASRSDHVTLNLCESGKDIGNTKTLRAVEATNKGLGASQFEIEDPELIEHLSTSKTNGAKLYVSIDRSPLWGWVYGGQE